MGATHHGSGGQVGLELGADDAGVAMGAGDLAPDAAVVRAAALGLGLVHVRHALPRVPRHVLRVHPLNLHHRRVLVLVQLRSVLNTQHQAHRRHDRSKKCHADPRGFTDSADALIHLL